MIFSIFLLNSFLLALSLLNAATLRRPSKFQEFTGEIAVLLPMRNEEENVERILQELIAQAGVPQMKIIVIDDNSEDRTLERAKQFESERTHIVSAPPLPSGWIGKVNALQAGYNYLGREVPEIVISIDADVHFEPTAIAQAAATLHESKLDFISPYPQQIALTWSERMIQPLLQWSWMSTVFLRGAEKYPLTSTVICNGQFLVLKGASLQEIDGFESVATKVLDDMELGRSLISSGFRGAVIDGSALSATRMYASFKEIRAGYGKSLHLAFGGILGSTIAALFIAATGILPFIYAASGDLIAIAACIAIIATRLVSAASSRGRLRDGALHPISALLFLYLLYFSWSNRGRTQWKGRTI
jgi:cellulose synthase/poly-beta-1,6-N-acetylglucosamine synthase-like glycosyltransferase